jgi:DNA-binding IclR family transcriptional regulator
MATEYTIPNLGKACQALKWIQRDPERPVTVKMVSKAVGIPYTTCFRILQTLAVETFLRREGDHYYLGPALIPLGLGARKNIGIRRVALPHLQALSDATGETVQLAIPTENRSMILEVVYGNHPLSATTSRPGTLVEMYCSATGKVFLTWALRDKLEDMAKAEKFIQRTPKTLVTVEELSRECDVIKERGYAIDEEEYFLGVRCIAAPVFDMDGRLVAAIGITATVITLPLGKLPEFSRQLLATTERISRQMGGDGESR